MNTTTIHNATKHTIANALTAPSLVLAGAVDTYRVAAGWNQHASIIKATPSYPSLPGGKKRTLRK